jgi:ABC-type multidrug transport system fused ATPase/permease subunit
MHITRFRLYRYLGLSLWLWRAVGSGGRARAWLTVALGVGARVSDMAVLAGTFHVVAMTVLSQMDARPAQIPGASWIAAALGFSGPLAGGLVAIAILFAAAALLHAASAHATAGAVRVGADAVVREVVESWAATRARGRQADWQAHDTFVERDHDRYAERAKNQVSMLLAIVQTGLVMVCCLAILTYFVPLLVGVLAPLLLGFFAIGAPMIYRLEKRTEARAVRERRTAAEARAAAVARAAGGDHESSDRQGTALAAALHETTRTAPRTADRQRARIESLRGQLQYALMFVAFVAILVHLHLSADAASEAGGLDLFAVVVVVLVARFTLAYARQFMQHLMRFNARFQGLQDLYQAATGADPRNAFQSLADVAMMRRHGFPVRAANSDATP